MPTILAIDSAIGISSCAVWHGGAVAAYRENRESTMQAAKLVPLIVETLQAADLNYGDLALVASTVGPGSFTGIRIGLAAARGIAFAACIPCVGYTTLSVMHEAGGELCILNAGKGEIFWQYFGKGKTEPAIGMLEEVLARYPAATVASSMSPAEITHPRADALARLAATRPESALPPVPFYIRPPDAKPSAVAQVS